MREAGVNLVTVGVFAWARLEPEPGRFTFDWLDRFSTPAHEAGIRVNLATPTASPPPWFSLAHPDALPVTADGVRLTHGSRRHVLCRRPGLPGGCRTRRRGARPAVRQPSRRWRCGACTTSTAPTATATTWRRRSGVGCGDRHGAWRALNAAWGTAFWSQHVPLTGTRYCHRGPPGTYPTRISCSTFDASSPTSCGRPSGSSATVCARRRADVPITTNAVFGDWVPVDHRDWTDDMDLVRWTPIPRCRDEAEEQTAFLATLPATGPVDGRGC